MTTFEQYCRALSRKRNLQHRRRMLSSRCEHAHRGSLEPGDYYIPACWTEDPANFEPVDDPDDDPVCPACRERLATDAEFAAVCDEVRRLWQAVRKAIVDTPPPQR